MSPPIYLASPKRLVAPVALSLAAPAPFAVAVAVAGPMRNSKHGSGAADAVAAPARAKRTLWWKARGPDVDPPAPSGGRRRRSPVFAVWKGA